MVLCRRLGLKHDATGRALVSFKRGKKKEKETTKNVNILMEKTNELEDSDSAGLQISPVHGAADPHPSPPG